MIKYASIKRYHTQIQVTFISYNWHNIHFDLLITANYSIKLHFYQLHQNVMMPT